MKNILHISYSRIGGAGRVADALTRAQGSLENYRSDFLFQVESDLWSKPFQDIQTTAKTAVDNLLVKKSSSLQLFSLYRQRSEKKILEKLINHNGVLHFHWINGILTFDDLMSPKLFSKNTVWTFHDMNPITGGCHHSLDCLGYETSCKSCPIVHKIFAEEVKKSKLKKNQFFSRKKNLRVVVPSNWLADRVIASQFINKDAVKIIPNPIDDHFFGSVDKILAKKNLKLPHNVFVVGFVSQQLGNPLKNLKKLIELIKIAQIRLNREIVVLGIGASHQNYRGVNFRFLTTGEIKNQQYLIDCYGAIDIIVSTSLAETFGLSIAEAAALGIPSLVLKGTATEEMIVNGRSGFVAQSDEDFVKKLIEYATNEDLRKIMGENAQLQAQENFDTENIIKKYDDVYSEMLQR